MASPQELSDFLSSVEQRAFKQAVYAVRDDDAALDIVQDAMIKLAEKYGDRPAAELPLVFTRILQNRIHDWFRRQKVRNAWVTLFSNMGKKSDENDDFDPLESLSAPDDSEIHQDGAQKLEQSQLLQALETEISKLPARQREAFLMRYWDELSITETALAMRCSEGSVKTHCSRATQALAKALKLKGITL
ncbi:RNA polymerase sigma factor [Polynucleobacter sp. es-EL-1]|jgi:RNA polymerase sigma-70 factor (ECF subfamily)|uniref:RNA polymerase sigma factor n=1 Tax=Polynucleobacter sp. es-EL-1 TaxID=1855652 RepID=UPI000BCFDAA9|nr:RNA polymerase sigma factor [Polynucleobacter sp. es-EL-1]OYZ38455.1 MAG: RNA polymerase sigma factor [Polynucleobacter sp. 16-46-70]OZA41272.1 MAG: RNA polymerase sigma factor [Polynucleobacter sp. 17-46-58]HQR83307.1 RNA polymerase sigma factor [Polynucleobacter sp.]QWE11207.1 RNA polymerase sigma factor [Polynucleobacter sp. es-EL-1]HQS60200.1 RNA polymerase sigma factor [Polynucleobacter sp.]